MSNIQMTAVFEPCKEGGFIAEKHTPLLTYSITPSFPLFLFRVSWCLGVLVAKCFRAQRENPSFFS